MLTRIKNRILGITLREGNGKKVIVYTDDYQELEFSRYYVQKYLGNSNFKRLLRS